MKRRLFALLASAFAGQLVPRWVDEGMAVLSEPRERIQRYTDMLAKCKQNNEMFHLCDLMRLANYPNNPRYVGTFYAQSVSLVDYMVKDRGPQVFAEFLRDSMRKSYEAALKQHYGYNNFEDLQNAWYAATFDGEGKVAVKQK